MKIQLDKLKDSLVSYKKLIYILCLALVIRIIIATFYLLYWTPSNQFTDPWSTFLLSTLEPYADYKYWYQSQVQRFLYTDWMPYSHFSFPEFTVESWEEFISYMQNLINDLSTHNLYYPPFFLYILCIPAFFSIDLVFLPILIADLLLPFIVYKFLVDNKGKKVAEWGFLLSALCPISILYHGGLFLNTSLVILFFIITLYFIFKKKYIISVIMLAISCLIKQTIIFYVIPIIIYLALIKSNSESKERSYIYFKNLVIYGSTLLGILILGSLPWIVAYPQLYFQALNVDQSITFFPEFNSPGINFPMQWYDFLIDLKAPYWLLYILGFPNFTSLGIIIVEIIDVVLLIYWHRKDTLNWLRFLDLMVITAYLSHLFFLRGVYKYYFTFHIPLTILWICFHYGESLSKDKSLRMKGGFLLIITSFAFLLVPREFYLIIIWIICFIIAIKIVGFYKHDNINSMKELHKLE